MKKTKEQEGITLIALIIIVLLILAVVSINSIQNDGMMNKTQYVANKSNEAKEREEINLMLTEWQLVKYTKEDTTFEGFLEEKFGENNVVDNGDGKHTVTVESGNRYEIQEDGIITLKDKSNDETNVVEKEMSIIATGMPLTLKKGETATVTGTLQATLVGITGEVTWSNENNAVATISAETGESITVTAVSTGKTKVTASCDGYSAEYIVEVEEISIAKVGSYVEYDISYTDMYTEVEYTSANGWRYLGEDDSGNKLLVSTAIPAILYYYCDPDTLPTWWATDTEVQADTGLFNTTLGWDNISGEPNKYASYGLRYKFESILFKYQASTTTLPTQNTGVFRQVGSTTSGENIYLSFRASGVNVQGVHNLTLAELNRAVNSANGNSDRSETSIAAGFKDLDGDTLGLFDMEDLIGYTDNPNYTEKYTYWLASPSTYDKCSLSYVTHSNSIIHYYRSWDSGIRPVVVLSSNTEIVDTNEDGIYEIQQ